MNLFGVAAIAIQRVLQEVSEYTQEEMRWLKERCLSALGTGPDLQRFLGKEVIPHAIQDHGLLRRRQIGQYSVQVFA